MGWEDTNEPDFYRLAGYDIDPYELRVELLRLSPSVCSCDQNPRRL
jgi:hypothetical protein